MQQVQPGIHCQYQVFGGVAGGFQNAPYPLFFVIVAHDFAVIDDDAPQPLRFPAVAKRAAGEGDGLRVLLAGEDGQVNPERLAGADAAAEQGPDPVLAGLAVEQGLLGRQLGAGL